MGIKEEIQRLIDAELRNKDRDAAGIFTPRGIDSAIRIKALRECLEIVQRKE